MRDYEIREVVGGFIVALTEKNLPTVIGFKVATRELAEKIGQGWRNYSHRIDLTEEA